MMKVWMHYPARCTGSPFDPPNLRTSARGLTGSEEAFFRYAEELAKLDHQVHVLCRTDPGGPRDGVWVNGIRYWHDDQTEQALHPFVGMDAVVSWMSPDACAFAAVNFQHVSFRLYVEQCSDHGNTPYDWPQYVQAFGTLSRSHAAHMRPQSSVPASRCVMVPNGVDPEEFRPGPKVRGRCVWASSHDRGLHHLLAAWPAVKRDAPHATLRVLYSPEGMHRFAELPEQQVAWMENLRRRSAYQLEALERLKPLGVELVGSVSRAQMVEELTTAEVLAYPCDPVRYTETFGSTVLEAMAAGCVPVLCLSDAFAELWGPHCPGVPAPYDSAQYAKLLAGVLNRHEAREGDAAACITAARAYSWEMMGKRMSEFLESRGERGFERPFT